MAGRSRSVGVLVAAFTLAACGSTARDSAPTAAAVTTAATSLPAATVTTIVAQVTITVATPSSTSDPGVTSQTTASTAALPQTSVPGTPAVTTSPPGTSDPRVTSQTTASTAAPQTSVPGTPAVPPPTTASTATTAITTTTGPSSTVDPVMQVASDLVGRWEGAATVPQGWNHLGQVWIEFAVDGTYRTGYGEDGVVPALYYGAVCDCPSNTWSVATVDSDGSAEIDIDISWDSSPETTRGHLSGVTVAGESLNFAFYPRWLGMIGPIGYELQRTAA